MGERLMQLLQNNYIEILAVLPAVLMLAGLFFTIGIDTYIRQEQKRTLLILCMLVLSLIVQNFLDYLLTVGQPRILMRTVVSIYGYCVRPVILVLFIRIVSPRRNYTAIWILLGVNAAIHLTAFFTGICFTIDADNHFVGGLPLLRNSCLFTSLILLGLLLFLTIRKFRPNGGREAWIPVFVTLLILLSVILDGNIGTVAQPISFLTIAIVICCALFYNWLHLQFVREHEQALQTEQRVQLMLSQIKPHFLYNALGAIEELCDSDPTAARDATVKFSDYLRGNMNAISSSGRVPFERELSHARLYLELEQLRFEDAIRVEYDIRCSDFSIPALTLEPIVENAVRHGIRAKPGGRGTVSISTREAHGFFEISVEDDGPGFNPESIPDDGQTHVGIQNVRDRLKTVCHGELLIESQETGTRITIRVPRNSGG